VVHTQDIRYALRLLARSPGFTLLTVLVLTGGLGLSTFTFSFLHTAMIRPLPLSDGDRIVRLTRLEDGRRRPVDAADLATLRASLRTVRELGGYRTRDVMIGRGGETRVVTVTDADPVLFSVARTPVQLGRPLFAADAAPGAEPVMVLTHRTWEVVFASSPAALDRVVPINGVGTRIVGVMPPGFGFPVAQDIWLPLPATDAGTAPSVDGVSLFARLAPGVTAAQAAAEASTVLQRIAAARQPSAPAKAVHAMSVESFPAAQIGEERTIVFAALNAAAGLILLLSLVNVTTLLTARANARVRETAVRMALGASTGRLVMHGLWETVILCVAGGVAGTAAAAWGLDAITRWTQANLEGNLAFWWVWQMDRVTIAGAGAFVTVAIAALGAVVSLRATRTNVRDVLQDGSARGGSRRDGRLARALVVTQVTTVTILMFAGVLSGVVAHRVLTLDPGYDPTRVLQVDLTPPAERFATVDARAAVFRDVHARLAEDGALSGVLLRKRLAARDSGGTFALHTSDPATASAPAHVLATLGAMSTLGIDLVQGRALDVSDDRRQAPVVAISRALAARQWPGRSPIGEQIRLAGRGDAEPWRTIVGVVSDVPYGNPFGRDRSAEAIYVPLLQAGIGDTDVFVRYRTSEMAGRQALHLVFGAVDPQMVPGFVFRASEVIEKSGLITVGLAKLFGACFAFALLLALAGTYGLMSASIGLRTREIGVRRALGASEAMAARMLLTQAARQLGVGTLIAAPVLLAIGVAATRLLPLGGALTAAAGVLVSAAIVAMVLATTWLPTRRVLSVPLRDAIWKD
jgi:predicted permease